VTESCATCRFSRPLTIDEFANLDHQKLDHQELDHQELDVQELDVRTCRRRAPQVAKELRSAWWPLVFNEDWCGEHDTGR